MEKRRVYQVAKEKKLSSDALISMLKSLGHEVKSHMSVVTPDMLGAIAKKIEEETKSSIEEVQRQKDKETKRKAETRPSRPSGGSASPSGASGGGGRRGGAARRPDAGPWLCDSRQIHQGSGDDRGLSGNQRPAAIAVAPTR